MDQKSLLEVLTSVTKVSGLGSETYTNEGYVLYSLSFPSIQQGGTETPAQGLSSSNLLATLPSADPSSARLCRQPWPPLHQALTLIHPNPRF